MGAVSLCTYGTVGNKMLHAREFDPVWQAASDAGLPVCVHVGWSYPPLREMCDEHVSSLNLSFTIPVMFGFMSFLGGGILDRFPKLRVGFLEAGAGWMPWFLDRIDHYHGVANWFRKSFGLESMPSQRPKTYKDRVYVTCEADELLLPQVIQYLGEDNIMVSEDMPHFEERDGSVRELEGREDVTEAVKKKILLDNPKRFYNL
jgi:predicted TIM-barrel fold metal-dependent hydrolase